MKKTAAYIRVSSRQQNQAMQETAVKAWAKAKGVKLQWYRDSFSGKTMERPGWLKLEADMRAGKIEQLIVWKLDRLGRTAAGLTKLFDELRERKIKLVSLTEGFDLSTTMGKLVANIMASVAEFETELRGERVAAGQALAKKNGKRWGGSRKGWTKLSAKKIDAILKLSKSGASKRSIAENLSLSWPTVNNIIKMAEIDQLPTKRGDINKFCSRDDYGLSFEK